jgi:hypothetical protein
MTRTEILKALAVAGYTGPTSYTKPHLTELYIEHVIAPARELADLMDDGWKDWLFYGARAFTDYTGTDRIDAALALLAHFSDEHYAARNNLTTTRSPYEIKRITLRRAS